MSQIVVLIFLLAIAVIYFSTYPLNSFQFIRHHLFKDSLEGSLVISLGIFLVYQSVSAPVMLVYTNSSWLVYLGYLLVVCGFVVFYLAKMHLGTSWGMPAQHDIKRQTRLVVSGIYKFSRNPIYVGLIIFFIGSELLLNSWLFLISIPIGIIVHSKVLKEEKLLHRYFPRDYPHYISSVPRYF